MNKTTFCLSILASAMALSSFNTLAAEEDGINIHGAVRINYAYKDYSESSKDKGGDFTFDMASLRFDGKLGNWGLKSDYRFTSGTNYIK